MSVEAIAAASMSMSAAQAADAVDVAMLKKAMEMEQVLALQVLEGLEKAMPTAPASRWASLGHMLDVSV